MTKEVFTENDFPKNPADIAKISAKIEETVNAMTQAAAQKDHMKAIAADVKEEYGIPPAIFNKLAKHAYDEASKDQEDAKNDVIDAGYHLFVKNNNRLDKGITMDGIAERDQILDALDD